MQTRKVRGPVDRASADGVEHQNVGRMAARTDGIIFRPPANVGAEVECAAVDLDFPVGTRRRVIARLHPVALLETDDPGRRDAQVGEALRDRRARGSRADHQHVCLLDRHR